MTLVGTFVGAATAVIVAYFGRKGSRRDRMNEQMTSLVDNLQEERNHTQQILDQERKEHREIVADLRADLRQCEQLRRDEFASAVESMMLDRKNRNDDK